MNDESIQKHSVPLTAMPSSNLSAMRNDLIKESVVELKSERYVFIEDYAFSSPSTAAGVIKGGSANGRDDWKDKHGVSLKQIQTTASNSVENNNA